jgi:hypothetical protein
VNGRTIVASGYIPLDLLMSNDQIIVSFSFCLIYSIFSAASIYTLV